MTEQLRNYGAHPRGWRLHLLSVKISSLTLTSWKIFCHTSHLYIYTSKHARALQRNRKCTPQQKKKAWLCAYVLMVYCPCRLNVGSTEEAWWTKTDKKRNVMVDETKRRKYYSLYYYITTTTTTILLTKNLLNKSIFWTELKNLL